MLFVCCGAMIKVITSSGIVVYIGRLGYLSFYSAGGISLKKVEETLQYIQTALSNNKPYGVNLLENSTNEQNEMALVDLLLCYNVHSIKVSVFIYITLAIVKFRLQGAKINHNSNVIACNHIIAKILRPEVAPLFLNPVPQMQEAKLAKKLPVTSDIFVKSDSGSYIDMGIMSVLLYSIIHLRNFMHFKSLIFHQKYELTQVVVLVH